MSRLALGCSLLFLSLRMASHVHAQTPVDIRDLKLRDWEPRSMLVSGTTNVLKATFPVLDVHNHLGGGKAMLTPERVARNLAEMDAAGVQTVVNLDGGWDVRLEETLAALDNAHPGRFLTYALINFDGIDESDWTERELKRLEAGFRAGAKGLKIHKTLGLGHRYVDIDARISELGRQPYSARRFLIKYQDRVLFGTDTTPSRDAYRLYFRFLETDDEYFDPAGGHHRQGFWMIYGIFLPDDVLAKLSNGNAKKLLFGLIDATSGH